MTFVALASRYASSDEFGIEGGRESVDPSGGLSWSVIFEVLRLQMLARPAAAHLVLEYQGREELNVFRRALIVHKGERFVEAYWSRLSSRSSRLSRLLADVI
jgi:hypothetical protein